MQCAYDQRGNRTPTILLRMQNHLYSGGSLRAEGIFRINAKNSKEEHVRNRLNKGVIPHGIDVHCLSREECAELVKLLPPTEASLLDFAINLMADVAQHKHHNKMNARNIAMVFAPNMTQVQL
ncbi:rac GTPase activating protein [Perilla frutescens var. hirtella]|nr:rac GTPase activating protein [Perilla frutescens var. hirtella]